MDGKTRLWAMRRSKWDGADGGLCSRRVWVGGTSDGGGAFTDGAAFGMGRRGYGTSVACARGGFGWETRLMGRAARLRMVNGAFSVCLTCLRIANGMFGI